MVVASVNGRRPDSAFSSVEIEIFASSASFWREMRRRANASRTAVAMDWLTASGNSVSYDVMAASSGPRMRTNPHKCLFRGS